MALMRVTRRNGGITALMVKPFAAAVLLGGLLGGLDGTAGAVPPPPVPPAAPTVGVGVQKLTVNWPGVPNALIYSVASSPAGLTCTTTETSCTFDHLNDATPWKFQLSYTDGTGTSGPSAWSAKVPVRTIVVVAGQSNAAGAGSVAAVPGWFNYLAATANPAADKNVRLTWFQPIDATTPSKGLDANTVALTDPQYRAWGSVGTQFFGPEVGAGRTLYNAGYRNLVMFKSVFSGSILVHKEDWPHLALWDPTTPGYMFTETIAGVRQLEASFAAKGIRAYVGSFIWYQGESDTNPVAAPQYRDRLKKLITQLRSRLDVNARAPFGIIQEDMLPGYSDNLARGASSLEESRQALAANEQVRDADSWAAWNLPNVVEVDSRGSSLIGDLVHLDMVGEMRVGNLIGQAIAQKGMP